MNISVAMATFNGATFLDEQLRSLRSQTLPPFQLVINDDGSQDDTLDICRRFAEDANFPVSVVSNPARVGWKRNFLLAASRCSGDYIAFCDQDDVWLPRKLERLALLASRTGAVAVACGVEIFTGPRARPRHRWLAQKNTTRFDISAAYHGGFDGKSMLFRRGLVSWAAYQDELLDPLFEGAITHDRLVMLAALCIGEAWRNPETLVMFRRHASQITADTGARWAGSDTYAYQSEVLLSWADALPGIAEAENLQIGPATRVSVAVETFRRLSLAQSQRAAIYRAGSASGAASRFYEMCRGGGYGPVSRGRLGTRSLIKDLAVVLSKLAPRSISTLR